MNFIAIPPYKKIYGTWQDIHRTSELVTLQDAVTRTVKVTSINGHWDLCRTNDKFYTDSPILMIRRVALVDRDYMLSASKRTIAVHFSRNRSMSI